VSAQSPSGARAHVSAPMVAGELRTNVGTLLAKRAELGPDLEAVVDVAAGRRFTYAQISERADRVAEMLGAQGVRPGDRVAVLLPNGHRFVELYYGAARAGVIVVPLNLRLVADEVAFILRDSGATVLISGGSHAELVADLAARGGDSAVPVRTWLTVGPSELPGALDYDALIDAGSGEPFIPVGGGDDPLFIMYTSGTTGHPKGTVHTHDTVEWSLLTVVASFDLRYRDRVLVSMPLYHIAAFNNMATTLYKAGTAVIVEKFEPEDFWMTLRDERINMTLAVPAMLNAMLATYDADRHQPLALRWLMSGAQAIPNSLLDAYAELGMEICFAYGLTEACGVGCAMPPEYARAHPGSIGRAMFHTEIRVVDAQGNDCEADVPGELIMRGRHVMARYWNLPDQTRQTVQDGWLHTGDVAVRDADGFFSIRDRLKDMIISGGENIYPAELEAVLVTHPQIADIAVIGIPSERWGESPMAVVVRGDDSLEAEEVLEFCQGRVARFKLPKAVMFIDEIPRNATGKALKRVLRDQVTAVAPE
jgi:acyl-CoA synthetase (AMP-forming)/AMP-acid ligase II